MEDLFEFVVDLLCDLTGGLIDSKGAPKVVRYAVATIVYLFLIILFFALAIGGDTLGGKIICGVLAVIFLVLYLFTLRKISRS